MTVGPSALALYAAAPATASALGGALALLRPPGVRTAAAAQLFTAGVIFAAVAVELLPELSHQRPAVVAAGFAIGTMAMLTLRAQTRRLESVPRVGSAASGVVLALTADTAIDGLLLGVAFASGAKQGFVLALALGLEALFLNLSATAALQRAGASSGRLTASAAGLALLLATSATIGLLVFSALPSGLFPAFVAFGVAALLYSVTEELLIEAHDEDEPARVTVAFFAGFLLVLLLELR